MRRTRHLNNRVVITGLGTVNPLANDVPRFWGALQAGVSGIRRVEQIATDDLTVRIGGEVRDVPAARAEINDHVCVRRMDNASLFAVLAAREALEDAGLIGAELGERGAVVIGAGLAGLMTLQEQTEKLLSGGPRKVSPLTIPLLMPNAAAANISLAFGLQGTTYTVSSACASSGHAIIDAIRLIRDGEADVVVTGGSEASMTRLGFASFINMRAMAKGSDESPSGAIRPFDARRDGLIMSEGAGVVIVESEEHARRRGRVPYAELIGYGMTSDAHHLTHPEPSAKMAARAVETSLSRAALRPGDIAGSLYVNAHGTGTKLNDAMETRALRTAFGESAERLQVSSTKSMTGHMIGASCGIEMIACCLALRDGVLPPTINLEQPDPECDLDYVPGTARRAQVEYALNNCFGFGGHNVSLLIRRWS